MALHFIALIFSICSFVLLLIANLGTTFESTFLPDIYLVQVNQAVNGRSIRYGVYSSCLYYKENTKSPHSCSAKLPGYSFDANQFADVCGADLTNSTMVETYTNVVKGAQLTTFKGIVLIMPAVILAFFGLVCSLLIRRMRQNNIIPFIGTFSSLFAFFTGAAGLALVIVTFWKGLATLEKAVEGLSHQWGPAIYLVGIGSGCILITLVCFVISLFTYKSESYKRETFHLYDYDMNASTNNHKPIGIATSPFEAQTTYLNTPTKQDDYEYTHAISSPTAQNYPSYHQPQHQTYQPQTTYQQGNHYY